MLKWTLEKIGYKRIRIKYQNIKIQIPLDTETSSAHEAGVVQRSTLNL